MTLIATKLCIPPARPGWVTRRRLLEKLDQGVHDGHLLTLVSAPAGYGKTTLLSDWLRTRQAPAAWLSLDEQDNDPFHFWFYIIAALQTVRLDLAQVTLEALQSPQPPPAQLWLPQFLNDIGTLPGPTVLVLDDFHIITDPAIQEDLAFLVEHLPASLHLVLSTRTDPLLALARLRACGLLTEIRAAELRFSLDEATAFLTHCMRLNLRSEDVDLLVDRTEGWAVGLQLAALALQGPGQPGSRLAGLTGTHHYVLEYLVEQVLSRLPAPVQDFLTQTSILDRMCGPLCDAITEGQDSYAQLAALHQANLFLIPLDEEHSWYRYHHLFTDCLQARLRQSQPDIVPQLHCRAAEWYQRSGLVTEAVRHWLHGKDYERAAQLAERSILPYLLRGEIGTVLAWINTLPGELILRRPWLSVYAAWARAFASQMDQIEPLLEAAERQAHGTGGGRMPTETASLFGNIASIRAYAAMLAGDLAAATEHASTARQYLPDSDPMTRSTITFILADVDQITGDLAHAGECLSQVARMGQAAGNAHLTIMALVELAYIRKVQGRLNEAAALYRQCLSLAGDQGISQFPALGSIKVGMGDLLREWNDLDTALQWITEGIEYNERRGSPNLLAQSYLSLARLLQARGDLDGAFEALHKAESLIAAYRVNPRASNAAQALRVRLWLTRGNLAAATAWLHTNPVEVSHAYGYVQEPRTVAQARVLIANGRSREAMALLTQLGQAVRAGERRGSPIEILALEALAWQAQGDRRQAMPILGQALSLAEPEGYIRIFVDEGPAMAELLRHASARAQPSDYVRRLLAAFGPMLPTLPRRERASSQAHTQPAFDLAEPLTDRELEVLRWLAEGLSNREIAQKLYLSPNTLRVYTYHLYGKLDVHSRMQAVRKGRELGLIPQQ